MICDPKEDDMGVNWEWVYWNRVNKTQITLRWSRDGWHEKLFFSLSLNVSSFSGRLPLCKCNSVFVSWTFHAHLPVLACEASWCSHKVSSVPRNIPPETGSALIDVSKQKKSNNKTKQNLTNQTENPTKTESKDKKIKTKNPNQHKVLQLFLHHCSQLQ